MFGNVEAATVKSPDAPGVNLNGGGTYSLMGGKQKTHIIGVNWYWNNYMRMMFDYSHSKITDATDVFSPGFNSVDTFSMRAQVDW